MDPEDENTEIELNRAQEGLNQKLNLVKVTLGCYRKKGECHKNKYWSKTNSIELIENCPLFVSFLAHHKIS